MTITVGDEVRSKLGALGRVAEEAATPGAHWVDWYVEQSEGVCRPASGWYPTSGLHKAESHVDDRPAPVYPGALPQIWREFADTVDRLGATGYTKVTPVAMLRQCANQLEAALNALATNQVAIEQWTSHLTVDELAAGDDRQSMTEEQLRANRDAHEANREI